MNIFSIIMIAIGLAADAFSVAIAKGVLMNKIKLTDALKISSMFGFFQFLMPCAGFYAVGDFLDIILKWSDLIAFFMLGIIGGKMIYDSVTGKIECDVKMSVAALIIPAVATSIDALAVGVTLSVFEEEILIPSLIIGITAFLFSFCGVYIGRRFGEKIGKFGEIAGGAVLLLLAFKFLIF